jgi:hypothetical protein
VAPSEYKVQYWLVLSVNSTEFFFTRPGFSPNIFLFVEEFIFVFPLDKRIIKPVKRIFLITFHKKVRGGEGGETKEM